jgi:FkbM family methyltransferase
MEEKAHDGRVMSTPRDDIARELLEHTLSDRTLVERPAPELARGVQAAVYGAGNVGREVARLLLGRGVIVSHFIDARAARLRVVDGLPVVSPETTHVASMPVVIGVFNRDADPDAIHTRMRASGAVRLIDFLELHARFSSELGDRYWLVAQGELRSHEAAMRAGLERWRDSESRLHYAQLLAYRLTGDPSLLPNPEEGIQYRPADLPSPAGAARFVDGGAFDGDTMRAWEQAGLALDRYWGFEPDPENFGALERWWNSRGSAVKHELFQAALGASNGSARFSAGTGEASALGAGPGADGGIEVRVRSIDDAIGDGAPTEIKLDIEGAEPDALEGARRVIERARPRLAICAYHRCGHLWSIARWIEDLNAGYALHLRPHAHSGFDAVVYAIQHQE